MDTLAMIIDTLRKLTEVHERLLKLAKQKQESLVAGGDVTVLQSIISSESACIERVQYLERERMQEVQQYFIENGVAVKSPTIKDLIGMMEDNTADKLTLEKEAQHLLLMINELQTQNEQNKLLLQVSLSYIQYSLSFFIKKEPSIGYGPRSSQGSSSLLDARI